MNYLFKYEKILWARGIDIIAGVDEAGRGPLAGPLVVASVVLKKEKLQSVEQEIAKVCQNFEGENPRNYDVSLESELEPYSLINDSKKLTEKRRNVLSDFIKKEAETFILIEISPEEIDARGIGAANKRGFTDAVKKLPCEIDHVLSDHYRIEGIDSESQTNISKGDCLSIHIAAASILAKVHRDKIMKDIAKKYPDYGFERHKGYGTKAHREAIFKYGPCSIHRKSFEPTKTLLEKKF